MSYDVFMIDPPWPKKKGGLRKQRPNQGRDLDYRTLSISEIFTILDAEILPLAHSPHVVFLWCIDSVLVIAESQMQKRGYKRHARLIWDKQNGVAPAFTIRYTHEYLIWYYKPTLLPIARSLRGKLTTVWSEAAREHSRKPEIAYRNIESLYPGTNRLDCFARQIRPGWDCHGDQTKHFPPKRPKPLNR